MATPKIEPNPPIESFGLRPVKDTLLTLILLKLPVVALKVEPNNPLISMEHTLRRPVKSRYKPNPIGKLILPLHVKALNEPLMTDMLDILIFGFRDTMSFKILMLAPATKVCVVDIVVPLMFIPEPAIKVSWTLGAVIEVAVIFVPDRLIMEALLALTCDTLA